MKTFEKPSWGSYIHELLDKPHADRTEKENFRLLFHDIKDKYEGINKPSDFSEELHEHYYGVKNKDLSVIHREIFDLSEEDRKIEIKDPCRPGKFHLEQKGAIIDRLCEILEIKKNDNFHSQIKHNRIYEEDIKNSKWYRHVLTYKHELREIFGYEIGKDFEDAPLKYFKTFCFKIMGIVCSLEHPKGMHPDNFEDLWKQHKKEDIYRKHYKEVFPKGRYAPTKMRNCSDDWINKKIAKGEKLTTAEQKLRALRKHVEIHKKQPRYKRYLSGRENSILLKLQIKDEIKNAQQNGGSLG